MTDLLARWIVRRPAALLAMGVAIAAASILVLSRSGALDSDILNLLPAGNPAVEGLRQYNRDFTQTRELAFLLDWEQPPEDLDDQRARFAALLAAQPWVTRVLDRPPIESGGVADPRLIVPLLMNLPPAKFSDALATLDKETLAARLANLAQRAAAGSPRALMELETDPLGLAGRAAEPVWETVSLSNAFEMVSPDGTAAIVPVITNITDTSAEACRDVMAAVRSFLAEAAPALGPGAPTISVTGRAAYVDEISRAMERDIAITSSLSLLAVTALFWLGFRRLLPLVGIALILALTALVATALGALVFTKLNMIATGFCSILFGLGDDFSLLLCQRYDQAIAAGRSRQDAVAFSLRHSAPGILWVSITTGLGFVALVFSGSAGFGQLGVLVAIGVMLCAGFMIVLTLVFVRGAPRAVLGPATSWTSLCAAGPRRVAGSFLAVALVAGGIAIAPWRPLRFDLSPASLEPRNTPAAVTLARMMEVFPATFEPTMVVLHDPSRTALDSLDTTLAGLQRDGRIDSFSSPSALIIDRARWTENTATLRAWDAATARRALDSAMDSSGVNPSAFEGAGRLVAALSEPPAPTWSGNLPEQSAWWFLLDRMVSPDGKSGIAYLRVPSDITPEERRALAESIQSAVPGALVTGWSQTLAELVPWAKRELLVFSGLVATVVLVVLFFVYRDPVVWAIHGLALLAAAAGIAATLKLLDLPINLLNVLAFPLIIGVGVDYGTHLILAGREPGPLRDNLANVVKPVAISGLTTATGFGALVLADNPSLSGLGTICAIGVLWCLAASLAIVTPLTCLRRRDQPASVAE